ncbi:MAG TPA: lysine N(6)-hydroxylase/L-ornithine N(5)-oxygenase family protein [Actinophytocola sp.]|uniref:lysine N(6)-hydroxylase/L-ornithine N(5)-oxygenase family protein n=1 Tax=Actinophytocola sp. TaxID=1872138 RepID=UPI002DDD29EE|nr:lysine N(6)-hydroxylase/L-ornithine N(5)-oxygenase family protein [Actinophytocola sp.]HEV2782385.1 lysine N(6)-hydroxylase/L-ornithine N(5)-oxygenase family protein [Actinophytocola sp.]
MRPGDPGVPMYDVVGVGFGPSNLALAIALDEHNRDAETPLSALFLERQPRFGWHRGMLIDDATMQVSFLKDLVTLRNPTSEFSFLAYLHGRGRLIDFVNHKSLFPLRVEFHDYLEWAAARFADRVRYGHEVTAVRPLPGGFEVTAGTGERSVPFRARNLVLGLGLEPNLPEGAVLGARIWHNRDLLGRIDDLGDLAAGRFAVVGAGQSAAEVTKFLHERFPDADVCAIFSRYGYSPADDSPFANRVFDPAAVDQFYAAPDDVKQRILGYHANTNYSVVDSDLIEELYRRVYREKVLGAERLKIYNASRVVEVVETVGGVRATVESMTTRAKSVLDCDVLVYATGYRPADPLALLGDAATACRLDGAGRVRVDRDYRLVSDLDAGIYLQGGTEHTHGISSSLLSTTVVRVADILQSIVRRRHAGPDMWTPATLANASPVR